MHRQNAPPLCAPGRRLRQALPSGPGRFPSGATIRFAYMKTDDDVWKYLGPRYSFIGFDESTLHTEKQVRNISGPVELD